MLDRRSDDGGGDDGSAHRLMYVARSSARVAADYGERLERLSREGFDVHVLAGPDGGFEELVERGVHCRSIPVVYRGNLPGLVGAFFIVQAYFIEQRPVLVHAHDGPLAWMGALAASRASVPAIFATFGDHGFDESATDFGAASLRWVWPRLVEVLEERLGGWVGRVASPIAEKGREWMISHLGELVDRYVVTTDRELEELEGRRWVPAHKIERIVGGSGIDIDRFDPERDDLDDRDEIRRRLGLPPDWRFVVGHAGPLRPDRGGLDALRVLDRIGRRRRDVGWLFSAEADEGPERALAERARQGRLVVAGESDDPEWYAAVDVLVHTCRDADVSKVLMRAQAMRVPVVAYDSAANESVVADGQSGYLIASGDVEALAETLDRLVDNPKRLRDFGRRGRTRSVKRFDEEQVESQVLRLYDTVLEQKLQT